MLCDYFLPPNTDGFQPLDVGVSTSKVLDMVVVVLPRWEEGAKPFSTSLSCFADLDGGGESRRTPVRLFWRLDTSERPVKRREARRIDWRTSHWRFFASQKRTADPA